MFGGNRSSLGKANDVWVFDLWINEWIELSPSGTLPAARDGAASAYVASEDRMVVFGGASTGVLADVWSLNNLSDTPTGFDPPNGVTAVGAVLHQNYPNPFNPTTVIGYELVDRGNVSLTVFDLAGREVRTLIEGIEASGSHRVFWDGRNNAGARVSSGVYMYRLRAGSEVRTRKMHLLK